MLKPRISSKNFALGIIATVNQNIDFDTAFLVGTELGYEIEKSFPLKREFLAREEEGKEMKKPAPCRLL